MSRPPVKMVFSDFFSLLIPLLFVLFSSNVYCLEYEFTFIVDPGAMECFYQPIDERNTLLEIDYQVNANLEIQGCFL